MIKKMSYGVELYSAAQCNLACRYCYIPKDEEFTHKTQLKIIEEIESGNYIKRMKNIFGDKVTNMAHWGTEPTLTLSRFKSFYEEVVETFPNFKTFMLSSNFMTDPNIIFKFIRDFPKIRKMNFNIQCSLDGPDWITDHNRTNGSTKIITTNLLTLIKMLNDEELFHNVRISFKATISEYGLELLSKYDKLFEYYQFFDKLAVQIKNIGSNKNVFIIFECNPTLATPIDYTKQDGIKLSIISKNQIDMFDKFEIVRPNCYYTKKISETLGMDKYFTRHDKFHCSAGDTMYSLGMDNSIHLCHRTFHMTNESNQAHLLSDTETSNQDDVIRGRHDLLVNNYTSNADDKCRLARMVLIGRSFQDFALHKLNINVALIREMALAGELSKCYMNKEYAGKLVFMNYALECPMDNVMSYGSCSINQQGLYRVFGNGLCEKIIGVEEN